MIGGHVVPRKALMLWENEIQKMGVMCWYDRRMRVGQYEM